MVLSLPLVPVTGCDPGLGLGRLDPVIVPGTPVMIVVFGFVLGLVG